MTYKEAYEEWYEYKKRMVKHSTMAAYALSNRTHLQPAFGGMDVQTIRRKDVQAFVYSKLDGGMSVKSVRDMLIVLKMVIRWVSEESDIAVFTNGYEVQPTEAVLGVVKQVSGDVPVE